MLEDNVSLESLAIRKCDRFNIIAEGYVALVTVHLHNTKLKSIPFQNDGILRLTDEEDRQMAVLLQKNYALESLPDINQGGDVDAILRLNEAGRRYLFQDGSSTSKGVEALSAVSNEISCVFLHLLENPRLWLYDRSAVETVSAGESNGSSTSSTAAGSGGGKRERASVHEGKASHRRHV